VVVTGASGNVGTSVLASLQRDHRVADDSEQRPGERPYSILEQPASR
jgi:uncharacterized protein YbjT (DUF2867 family)